MTVLAIGEPLFLHRHRGLLDHLATPDMAVRIAPLDGYVAAGRAGAALRCAHLGARTLGQGARLDYLSQKNAHAFRVRSRRADRLVRSAGEIDAVLQVFSQFHTDAGPATPTFLLVDYTMRLAMRHWPAWAWFPTARARGRWLAVERRAYRCATRLFAMSAAVRGSLVDDYGIDPRNVIVVGSAPSIVGHPELRRYPTGSLLMNVSDFRRKGGDIALAALASIRRSHPDARLTLVGGRRTVVAEGVDDLGVVGPDRVRGLFAAADLVLAPARCDPFPTFLVEAQQAGVPVVASARDGMREIVEDGVTGTLLNDLTPAALSAAVVELLGDPGRRSAMSQAAAQRAARRFSWAAIAPVVRGEIARERHPRAAGIVRPNTTSLPQISAPRGLSPTISCNAGRARPEWSNVG